MTKGAGELHIAENTGDITLPEDIPETIRYTGEMKDGRFHGQGVLVEDYGKHERCETRGQFADGQFEGHVQQVCQSGSRHEGMMQRGRMTGFGSVTLPRGHEDYTGQIAQYQQAGQGSWHGALFKVTGWWENGALRVACPDEKQCRDTITKLDAELARQGESERKAGVRPYIPLKQSAESNQAIVGMPYEWLSQSGTVLYQAVSEEDGKAYIVADPQGATRYRLRLANGVYAEFEVAAACWQRPVNALQTCMSLVTNGSEQAEEEVPEAAQPSLTKTNQAKEIILADLKDTVDIAQILQQQQDKWMRQQPTLASQQHFVCKPYQASIPDAAQQAFDEAASLSRGDEQQIAYAKAAVAGNWRAAARLVTLMLEDEDWESALPITQWLFEHDVPAAYNKLADIMAVMGGYDGGQPSQGTTSLISSLRWQAAQSGDPVAQITLARMTRSNGQITFADDLSHCAKQQNPELQE